MVQTEAPIIVPKMSEIVNYCQNCMLKYNYILANPKVRVFNKYLEIKLDTNDVDEIESDLIKGNDGSRGRLNEARLYCPPQNNYDKIHGKNVIKAELILIHENSKSHETTLSICIPIKTTTQRGLDAKQFEKIIGVATPDDMTTVSLSNFTVNNFIPISKYIILEDTKGAWYSSSGKNNIIIFYEATHLLNENLSRLENLINSDGITTNTFDLNSVKITKYDKLINGPGMSQNTGLTCYPIDKNTGKRIKPGYWSKSTGEDPVKVTEGGFGVSALVISIVSIIGLIILVIGCLVMYKRIKHKLGVVDSINSASKIGMSVKSN